MGFRMREDTEGGAKNDGEIPRHASAALGMMFGGEWWGGDGSPHREDTEGGVVMAARFLEGLRE